MPNHENIEALKFIIKKASNADVVKEAGLLTFLRNIKNHRKLLSSVKGLSFTDDGAIAIRELQRAKNFRTGLGVAAGGGGYLYGALAAKAKAKAKAAEMGNKLQEALKDMPIGERLRLSGGLLFKPGEVGAGINSQIRSTLDTL